MDERDDRGADWVRNSLIDTRRAIEQRQRSRAITGSSTIMGKVVDADDSTFGPFRYLAINPVTKYPDVDQTGAHVEDPEFDEDQKVMVLVIGNCTPRPGDMIVAHSISQGGRWVYYEFCQTSICVKLRRCGSIVPGLQAFVSLYDLDDPDEEPMLSCFASYGIVELRLDNPGSGYTDRVGYPLTFSDFTMPIGAAGPSGLFDVVDGKVTNVRLQGRALAINKAPTVSIPAFAGPGTGAVITAIMETICCVSARQLINYGILAQDAAGNFSVEGTAEAIDNETVVVELDLPSFARLQVNFTSNGCSQQAIAFSATLTGPDGYSQTRNTTLGSPNTVTFNSIIPAGDFTLTAVLINGAPFTPIPVHIEHCDNLVINVPRTGQTVTNTVKVIACTPIAGPALPNATVTITNASGTPPYFASGTTDSNGFFTFTGAYRDCNYIFSVMPPPDCPGWATPASQTATPTAKLFLVETLPGYTCAPTIPPKTIGPFVSFSGPGGAGVIDMNANHLGALQVTLPLTPCLPPNFDQVNSPGLTWISVGFSADPTNSSVGFILGICGAGGGTNVPPNVKNAAMEWAEADAWAGFGPGNEHTIRSGNFTATFCPLHAVITVTKADIDRVLNPTEPIYTALCDLLIGDWTFTD